MKLTELKKVLKETVREVIQEELKDILLEAVKSPKVVTQTPVMESFTPTPIPSPPIPSTPSMSAQDKRNAYKNILGETASSFKSNDAQIFKPNPAMDVANGALPSGNVGMDQIMGLMNTNK
jgi:hypothetical protein|tara:strand:+ start:2304 stop:2666 length:363 start_codon:yes stop_codon:yes gene_type:complete